MNPLPAKIGSLLSEPETARIIKSARHPAALAQNMAIVERAALYLEKLPPSIQGSGGSSALFGACCVLRRGFALSFEAAWPTILRWNETHARPSWSERELRLKLKDAENSTRPLGYLLDADNIGQIDRRTIVSVKQKHRSIWPQCCVPELAELEKIAELRSLSMSAVIGAAKAGFLFTATVDGHRSFVTREGKFAQARRFDGKPFQRANGDSIKAKNLPGSSGAFLGRVWLGGPEVRVLMVEGAIGILEGLAAHDFVSPVDGWTIVAATSAYSRFNRDPELMRALTGRRVRIVPDADEKGFDAAASWMGSLEGVGCTVDAIPLPPGIKDLGELMADPHRNSETLHRLFQ